MDGGYSAAVLMRSTLTCLNFPWWPISSRHLCLLLHMHMTTPLQHWYGIKFSLELIDQIKFSLRTILIDKETQTVKNTDNCTSHNRHISHYL